MKRKEGGVPKSAQKYYQQWIRAFPETEHPSDWNRFYMLVSVLLCNAKKQRSRGWFEQRLREDCKKLSAERVLKFGEIYQHIRDFKNVWKSWDAKLLALDERDQRIAELKQRLFGNRG